MLISQQLSSKKKQGFGERKQEATVGFRLLLLKACGPSENITYWQHTDEGVVHNLRMEDETGDNKTG